MEKTYYIYHIPGVKYGCTQNYPERPASQSEVYQLTEMHTDIMIASKREKDLNIAADYPWSDTQYYYKMVEMGKTGATSQLKSGKHNFQNNHYHTWNHHTSEHQANAGKIASTKPNHVSKLEVNCPHCQRVGGYAAMKRWHFSNCKLNPLKSS
jgi:hypothetical protein